MLKPLLILTLGISSFAAQAQTTETAPPAPSVPATTATTPALAPQALRRGQQDTINAIGRLYHKRRLGGKIWMGVTAGGGLSVLRVLLASSSSGSSSGGYSSSYNTQPQTQVDGGAVAVVTGLFVGFPLIVAINKLSTYSESNENKIVEAYRNGKALPRRVVRKLSPGYF